jgi:hypothetical protein
MGVRLLREPSEAPNIQNHDDARMIRYAYGGYDGIVQGIGSEVSLAQQGQNIHLGSGLIVLQGWEIELDEDGFDIPMYKDSVRSYYCIYARVNLLTQEATIGFTYSLDGYTYPNTGEDLSTYPTGTASLVLYTADSEEGNLVSSKRFVKIIPYTKDSVESLALDVSRLRNTLSAHKLYQHRVCIRRLAEGSVSGSTVELVRICFNLYIFSGSPLTLNTLYQQAALGGTGISSSCACSGWWYGNISSNVDYYPITSFRADASNLYVHTRPSGTDLTDNGEHRIPIDNTVSITDSVILVGSMLGV